MSSTPIALQSPRRSLAVSVAVIAIVSGCANPVYDQLDQPQVDISEQLEEANRDAEEEQRRMFEQLEQLAGDGDDELPIVFP